MSRPWYLAVAVVIIVMSPTIAVAQDDGHLSCLTVEPGGPAATIAGTEIASSGLVRGSAATLGSRISIPAFSQGRTIVPHLFRFVNHCEFPIELNLKGHSIGGDWSNRSAQVWLEPDRHDKASRALHVDTRGLGESIVVPAGSSPGPLGGQTASVLVSTGGSIRVGVGVVSGATAKAGQGGATIRWVTEASPAG